MSKNKIYDYFLTVRCAFCSFVIVLLYFISSNQIGVKIRNLWQFFYIFRSLLSDNIKTIKKYEKFIEFGKENIFWILFCHHFQFGKVILYKANK